MKSWDVIVIGSGAGGFAAAVTACCKGLSVLMLEKAPQFGGTSAISGGAVWINDTDQARAQGKSGTADAIKTYLKTIIGEQNYRPDIVDAFVTSGREALAFLEQEGAVKYSLRPSHRTITLMSRAPWTADAHWKLWSTTGASSAIAFAICALPHRGCCYLAA